MVRVHALKPMNLCQDHPAEWKYSDLGDLEMFLQERIDEGTVQANVSVSARIFAITSELVAFEMQRLKARSHLRA